jgi:hypothetical protein
VASGEIGQQLGISRSTLRRLRISGELRKGIHWINKPGSETRISWNRDLMRDWAANGGNCSAHDKAIEQYLASLPSSCA